MEPLKPSVSELDDASRALIIRAFQNSYPVEERSDAALEAWASRVSAPVTAVDLTIDSTAALEAAPADRTRMHKSVLRRLSMRGTSGPHGVLRKFVGAGAAIAAALIVALVSRGGGSSRAPHSVRTFATTYMQRATVRLSDGTRVTLAPGSRLSVSDDPSRAVRLVALTGHAYFDVVPSRQKSFVVRTGNVETRVLGTSFDVERYGAVASVAVTSGRVEVLATFDRDGRRARRAVVVPAGTIAIVTDSSIGTAARPDGTAKPTWLHGALVFRGAPVADVLDALGHWYGYQFKVADSTIVRRYFYGAFDGESSDQMLKTLQTVLKVTATVGDVVPTKDGKVRVVTLQQRHAEHAPTRREVQDSFTTNREIGR